MSLSNPPTIAVFDSGFGGLTVLRALLQLHRGARFLYLGDTARLPYGAKSQKTVARYALSSAEFLLERGAEMLVVACNTASALAMDEMKAELPIPVVGVIEPGVAAAASAGLGVDPSVMVLATAATVQSGAYGKACAGLGMQAYEKSCPLLVPLIEEGWTEHPVTAEVLRIYLTDALAEAPGATSLILGCTHYPLIRPLVERTLEQLGRPLRIVDSAGATAAAACALLPARTAEAGENACTFYATDSIEKFQRLGSAFLGQTLPAVHLVDLGG